MTGNFMQVNNGEHYMGCIYNNMNHESESELEEIFLTMTTNSSKLQNYSRKFERKFNL